jgi:hypothetical protein
MSELVIGFIARARWAAYGCPPSRVEYKLLVFDTSAEAIGELVKLGIKTNNAAPMESTWQARRSSPYPRQISSTR